MNCMEFGTENQEVILLLHGGGLSWWNYREEAALLQGRFHVVLPILDGHAGSSRGFTTMASCAAEIISMIDSRFGGQVCMLGGLSLGGQVLLEILAQRPDICRFAMVESALVVPSRMLHAMIPATFGSCYGLIRQKWFSRLQFQSLRIRPELFPEYYRDTCGIAKADLIAFMQANSLYTPADTLSRCSARVSIFVGSRENRAMRRSAQLLHSRIPGSTLHALPGLFHGEFSINYPEDYVQTLLAMIDAEETK